MSDGRYFTWIQFSNIFTLTFACIFSASIIVFFYLKSKNRSINDKIIRFAFLELIFSLLLYLDEVIFYLPASRIIKLVYLFIFTLIILEVIFYRIRTKDKFFKLYFPIIILTFMIFVIKPDLIFISNSFLEIEFTGYFRYFSVFITAISFISIFHYLFSICNEKYKLKATALISLPITVQAVAFTFWLFQEGEQQYKSFIFIIPLVLTCIFIAARRYMPDVYLPDSFSNIIEDFNELIIICDKKDKIIFQNKSDFIISISNSNSFDFSKASLLFNKNIEITLEKDNELNFSFEHNENKYFIKLIREEIYNKNNLLGYIYRFSDLTSYYQSLSDLNEKNDFLTRINNELQNYSKTVEELNSEKERNKLLFTVQEILGHNIAELIKMLESIQIYRKDSVLDDEVLGIAIEKARNNLSEIRNTVNKFKESFSN